MEEHVWNCMPQYHSGTEMESVGGDTQTPKLICGFKILV